MPRNYREKAAYKRAFKAGEKAVNATRNLGEMKAKFQAVHDEKKRLDPNEIHTHARQRTYPIRSFEELLTRPVPWCATTEDEERVYFFVDYCLQALKIMQIIIETLSTKGLAFLKEQQREATAAGEELTLKVLKPEEQEMLQRLRGAWLEFLKANLYTLWTPPPASGGATARYSIAVQLWLLVVHANVILQRSNAADKLFDFNPSASDYLLRNALVIDTSAVMCYTMRTLIMAVQKLLLDLDSIDRFHPDYIAYAVALEHRISEFITDVGGGEEFDALEWCVSHGEREVEEKKRAGKQSIIKQRAKAKEDAGGKSMRKNALRAGEEQCSDNFVLSTMIWMLTIYRYAECWFKLNVRELHDGRVQHMRVPWHVTARSKWVPSSRSIRALSQLLLHYAANLTSATYDSHMRAFLLQFNALASDMDEVRLYQKHNEVFARTVLEFEFKCRSVVSRAYLRKIYYDRRCKSYLDESFQWESGDRETTTSASLARQQFTRQSAVFFIFHLLVKARFGFPFKERVGPLQHRAVDFVETFEKRRLLGVPLLVWNFSRPCVFVPHRRRPELDYADIARWRANSRRLMERYGHKSGMELDAMDDLNAAMLDLQVTEEAARAGGHLAPDEVADVDPANAAEHALDPGEAAAHLRDLQTQQYHRVYDCPDAVTAIAVWAQWLLQINNGVIVETDMRQFLLDALEWVKPQLPGEMQ